MAVAHFPTRTTVGVNRAFLVLYFGYVLLPIIAGVDKFFHALAPWTQYLWLEVPRALNVTAEQFMKGVGIVEVAAGLLVAFSPRIGGFVVAAWLWGIVINLVMAGGYYDIALRDFGLSLGALALASLASSQRNRSVP